MMNKSFNINEFRLTDCREIIGNELYKINGGKQVENSNEGVANAQPGDTIIREDKTEITLNQGDIDWAQAHMGNGNTTTQTIQNPVDTNHTTNPINPTGTSTGATPSVSINSFTPVPTGNYEIDNINQIVSVDINNPQNIIDAYDSYFFLGDKGFSFQLSDGNNIIHTFKNAKEVKNYVKSVDISKGEITISEPLSTISTGSYVISECLDNATSYTDDAVRIAKLSKYSKVFSKVSNYCGYAATAIDATKVISKPNFDTISDVAIDVIGLIPGGALLSIGMSITKYYVKEAIDECIEYYKDFKTAEVASSFSSDPAEVNKLYMRQDYALMKTVDYGVKRTVPIMRLMP